MPEKFGTGTEEDIKGTENFFWRGDMPVSKDTSKDLVGYREISLESEQNSEAVKIGYDCSEYWLDSEGVVAKLFYVVFDPDGNPQEINEQEYTKLRESCIETYKIAQLSKSTNEAFVNEDFPSIIFVNSSFEIHNGYWKDVLKHEKTHAATPNLRYNGCIDTVGFMENLYNEEKEEWDSKGKLQEEWWACSVQEEEHVADGYKELFDLGNRIVGLLAELDGETIRRVFDNYGFEQGGFTEEWEYKEDYTTKFVNKWQSQNKDQRTTTMMELIGRARNVYSDRMIFRDLVNAIDPELFEMWFDGQLNNGDEDRINQKIDKIESKLSLKNLRKKLKKLLGRK